MLKVPSSDEEGVRGWWRRPLPVPAPAQNARASEEELARVIGGLTEIIG